MQVDIHSLMNNLVKNQLDLNFVDNCLGSIQQIVATLCKLEQPQNLQNLTCKILSLSLNFHWISIMLYSKQESFKNQAKRFAQLFIERRHFFVTPIITTI